MNIKKTTIEIITKYDQTKFKEPCRTPKAMYQKKNQRTIFNSSLVAGQGLYI